MVKYFLGGFKCLYPRPERTDIDLYEWFMCVIDRVHEGTNGGHLEGMIAYGE